jgi:hypothetical protein
LPGGPHHDARIREAAWIARCVGRGEAAPLTAGDLAALAQVVHNRNFEPGSAIFTAGHTGGQVWILRHGRIEVSVGSGARRSVVQAAGQPSSKPSSPCITRPAEVGMGSLVPSTASAASATSLSSPVPAQARTDATVGQATADSPPDSAPCLGMAGVNTCFEVNGDRFWVDDTASDGASAVAQWAVYCKGDGALVNSGQCNQSGGCVRGWSKCGAGGQGRAGACTARTSVRRPRPCVTVAGGWVAGGVSRVRPTPARG